MTALLVIGLLTLGALGVMRMGSNEKPVEQQPAVAAEPAPEPLPPLVRPPVAASQERPVLPKVPQVRAGPEPAAPAEVPTAVPVTRPRHTPPPVTAARSAQPAPVVRATAGKPAPPQRIAARPVEAPAIVVEQAGAVEVPVEAVPPVMVAASAAPPAGDTPDGESPAVTGRQADERAPGDLILDRKTRAMGFDPVVFPHWRHRIHFRCYVCHVQVFDMKRGASAITMEKMNKGEFCGKCHNGKVAFNVEFQNCARCHRPLAAAR